MAIMIKVTHGQETIGHIEPAEFRRAVGAPKAMFLPEVVQKWNAWKAKIGEPERVEICLARKPA